MQQERVRMRVWKVRERWKHIVERGGEELSKAEGQEVKYMAKKR